MTKSRFEAVESRLELRNAKTNRRSNFFFSTLKCNFNNYLFFYDSEEDVDLATLQQIMNRKQTETSTAKKVQKYEQTQN
jgi:hypothetical protein